MLEDLGIDIQRYNSDKSKLDNYGTRLLSLYKSLDVHIANGRLGKDKITGAVTCKNTTVVDYLRIEITILRLHPLMQNISLV